MERKINKFRLNKDDNIHKNKDLKLNSKINKHLHLE